MVASSIANGLVKAETTAGSCYAYHPEPTGTCCLMKPTLAPWRRWARLPLALGALCGKDAGPVLQSLPKKCTGEEELVKEVYYGLMAPGPPRRPQWGCTTEQGQLRLISAFLPPTVLEHVRRARPSIFDFGAEEDVTWAKANRKQRLFLPPHRRDLGLCMVEVRRMLQPCLNHAAKAVCLFLSVLNVADWRRVASSATGG